VPEVRDVQVIPSEEVRTVPPPPAITNCVPDQVTPLRGMLEDHQLELMVHTLPSGDVAIASVPALDPTVTNCDRVLDQVTPESGGGLYAPKLAPQVHVPPFVDVMQTLPVPNPPTATNFVPDQVTPLKLVDGRDPTATPESCQVHVTPSGEVRMVLAAPTAKNCAPDHATP
jgi:hypothetical protein